MNIAPLAQPLYTAGNCLAWYLSRAESHACDHLRGSALRVFNVSEVMEEILLTITVHCNLGNAGSQAWSWL